MKIFEYDNLILNEKISGLEITDNVIKILEVKKVRGKYNVVGFAEQEIDPASISDGIIINKELISETISNLRDHARPRRIRGRYVSIVLPDSRVFVRVVKFPAGMNKDEIREAIEWKSKDLIAMPLENVYWDWHRLHPEREGSEIEVGLSAVDKQCADSYIQTLKLAGLTPLYYDISGNAAARFLFQNDYKQTKALLVRIDRTATTLSLFLEGGVRYQTVIKDIVRGGFKSLIDYASAKLGIDKEETERVILLPENLNNDQRAILKGVFTVSYEGLYKEIEQIFEFYSQSFNHINVSNTKKELKNETQIQKKEIEATNSTQDNTNKKPVQQIKKELPNEIKKEVDGTGISSNQSRDSVNYEDFDKTLDGKGNNFDGVFIYGKGSKLYYLEEFFENKSINVKTKPLEQSAISPMLPFISRQSLPENLVLLGLSMRNLGLFRNLTDINLVPDTIKNSYLKISIYSSLYTYLKVIFWNVFIIGIILTSSFIISSIYKYNAENELKSIENIAESPANKEFQNDISYVNKTAGQINVLLDTQLDWDNFFNELSEKRGSGIVFENVLVSEDSEVWKAVSKEKKVVKEVGQIYLVLSGIAADRAELLRFVQDIESSNFLEDARMPISNYETNENIEFTIYCLVDTNKL